jgi:hypothetical protein
MVVFIVTHGSAGLVGDRNAGSLSGVQALPSRPADSIDGL